MPKKIKIIHLSDTHLGWTDLEKTVENGLNLRENDLYKVFIEAIDKILEIKPDIVIHAGDLFHRPSPSNRAITIALTQFKRLSDANIPIVAISGNHSTPRTQLSSPVLKIFETLNNFYAVYNQEYQNIEFAGIVIHAIPHITEDNKWIEEIDKLAPIRDKANLLIMHTSVGGAYLMEEYGERVFPNDKKDLLKDFDYIALGHWHKFQKTEGLDKAWYSGSIETLSEREVGKDKGILEVDIEKGKEPNVEFHKLSSRPWYSLIIKDCYKKDTQSIIKEIEDFADSKKTENDYVINIALRKIKSVDAIGVSTLKIEELFSNALNIKVSRDFYYDTEDVYTEDKINSESIVDLFSSHINMEIKDTNQAARIELLGKKYFDKQTRGEA